MLPPLRELSRWFLESAQAAAAITPISVRASSTGTGTSSTLTVNVPSGTVNGDVMVAAIGVQAATLSNATISTPSGWTQRGTTQQINGIQSLAVFTRVASSEPASYTWTFTGGSTGSSGIIASCEQVSNSSPLDGSAAFVIDSGATTSHVGPSYTPGLSNTGVFAGCNDAATNTWTVSSPFASIATTPGGGSSMVMADVIETTPTAEQLTATSSGSHRGISWVLGLAHA